MDVKFRLEKDQELETNIVYINGGIDIVTSPELEQFILKNCKDLKKLILDFTNVTYISSSGLRILLKMSKIFGDDNFAIKNVNPDVMEVLNLTGFCEIIKILD